MSTTSFPPSDGAVPGTETAPARDLKTHVREHWNTEPCGTRGLDRSDRRAFFSRLERERYELEPYIPGVARFDRGRDKHVLEIGVGAGTDFVNWARRGAIATGIDLTEHGVTLTRERLDLEQLSAQVLQADAETLPFPDASFDIVYSWGVLHHSPDTPRAIREVRRVLKPGGTATIMIYSLWSWVTLLLWLTHGVARGKPGRSPRAIVFEHLESPGTKVYTRSEAVDLFDGFSAVTVRTILSHGDLLRMAPSSKYRNRWHQLAWRLYPRPIVRALGDRFGMNLVIEATK